LLKIPPQRGIRHCRLLREGQDPCDIYVPEGTSPGKLVQIQAYGATLKKVEGSREKTAEVAMEVVSNAFYASHCWNPFFLHGTKNVCL